MINDPGADSRCVGERHIHPLEQAQITNGQHQARNRQRNRGQVVQPLPRWQLRAVNQIGNSVTPAQCPDVAARPAVFAGCCGSCRSCRVSEHGGVVRQRVGVGQRAVETPDLGRTTAAAHRCVAPSVSSRTKQLPRHRPATDSQPRPACGAAGNATALLQAWSSRLPFMTPVLPSRPWRRWRSEIMMTLMT
jgi:hypothetical protein